MEPNNPELPLRDIHLPEPIGWWPPAPGWWIVLFGVPTIIFLLIWLWRFLRRMTVKKLALAELESIAGSDREVRAKVQQLAILLRRIALSVYPREEVASLVGEQWLSFLDDSMRNTRFSVGAGRLLIEAPYRREVETDLDALIALCRDWIKSLPKAGRARLKGIRQTKDSMGQQNSSPPTQLETVETEEQHPVSDNSRFARPTGKEKIKP